MQTVRTILSQPPTAPALYAREAHYTYGDLAKFAGHLATAVKGGDSGPNNVVCILASRSLTAYGGCLAILTAGLGYVPLNPRFPVKRTQAMWHGAGSKTVIVGLEALDVATELLSELPEEALVLVPELNDTAELGARLPMHTVLGKHDIEGMAVLDFQDRQENSPAYLLFTSGSTGVPKGVPISVENMESYLRYMQSRYSFSPDDRFSQSFDMTFDLSVHDIFLAWLAGACLYAIPEEAVSMPGKFIRDHALTVWFSVPSTLIFMNRSRTLRPNVFPSLRLSFFCGEPLPVDVASKWSMSAPNSLVYNLYGPTEATIAIAEHEFDAEKDATRAVNGVTPIGSIFTSQHGALIDADRSPVEGAGRGELWLSGDQITAGYLNSPEKTRTAFVDLVIAGQDRWYRTGDLVERDADGLLHFVGRIDHQVKINGYRVELAEIESVMREEGEFDVAIAVPYSVGAENFTGVAAFIITSEGANFTEEKLIAACQTRLPPYMVPSRIWREDTLPLNGNGKFDRVELQRLTNERVRS